MEENKFCRFCGEKIPKESIVCTKCGRQLEIINETINEKKGETIVDNPKFYKQIWFMWIMLILFAPVGILLMWKFQPEMKKKTKTILTVVFVIFFIFMFSIVNSDDTTVNNYDKSSNTNTNNNSSNITSNTQNTDTKKKSYGFNETFEFDDLKITIGSDYSFVTVNNSYSEYNGKKVVKLPVTVENLKDETHGLNMFYYTVYGANGTEAKGLGSYFDEDIDFAGDLRSGAKYTKYMYFLYDTNGTYAIEFDNWSQKIVVEFDIK